MKTNPKGLLMLMLTALIWGSAFVAQSVGGAQMGPFSFNGVRSLIGGFALLAVIPLLDKLSGTKKQPATEQDKKNLWQGGILCGLILGAASSSQQWAMQFTSVGKAGFITALYIVIVPILGVVFFKKRPSAKLWGAVLIALVGLYLLCWNGEGSLGKGEALLLVCSVLFSLHILVVDHYSALADGVKLSCIQFFTAAAFCAVPAFVFESPSLAAIKNAWLPLLYAGVLSCGVAYTLQIVAQKLVEPTLASLVLSLESVFSVLAGWLVLGQVLSPKELFGCLLVFCAVILAQLPQRKKAAEQA